MMYLCLFCQNMAIGSVESRQGIFINLYDPPGLKKFVQFGQNLAIDSED